MAVGTNDAKSIIINFGGIDYSGFKKGDLWSASPMSRRYKSIRVLGGKRIFVKSNDDGWDFSLTLLRTAPSNRDLTLQNMIDALTKKVTLPFLLRDINGVEMIYANYGKIVSWPEFNGFGAKTWHWELLQTVPMVFGI